MSPLERAMMSPFTARLLAYLTLLSHSLGDFNTNFLTYLLPYLLTYFFTYLLTYFKVGGEPKPRVSWTKEDGKVLTRTTSGGEKGEQLIIKRVEPGDEGGF